MPKNRNDHSSNDQNKKEANLNRKINKSNLLTPQQRLSNCASNDTTSQLNRQKIQFAIEDAEDYLNNQDIYDIAPSRRQTLINKLDAIIEQLQKVCIDLVISESQREQIRDLRFKLERKANNLCCLIDDWQDGVIEETEEDEGEEEEDEQYGNWND